MTPPWVKQGVPQGNWCQVQGQKKHNDIEPCISTVAPHQCGSNNSTVCLSVMCGHYLAGSECLSDVCGSECLSVVCGSECLSVVCGSECLSVVSGSECLSVSVWE